MNRLSPRTTVMGGATIGLIAGVAIYGAVSSSATAKVATGVQPASANVAVAPANAAPCAAGQKLEDGVCVVHIERTVVIPAVPGSDSSLGPDPSTSGDEAVESSDQVAAETEAETESAETETETETEAETGTETEAESVAESDAAEPADDAAEHAAENDG